ncbi:MAG: SpoIID/LytB domain-containing protein [Deltaproteobacteria bacterium]|nr:SpoIID/LytB domain-containing protein [Deltaproteobacteria bacterium]
MDQVTFARIASLAAVAIGLLAAGRGVGGEPGDGMSDGMSEGMVVRVRILEVEGPIAVEGAGLGRKKIERTRRGLRVDGGSTLRRWRSDGAGGTGAGGTGAGATLWVGSASARGRGVADSSGSFRVQGALVVLPVDRGLAVVNEVPMESYVAGTLGAEMYSSWREEALRAQAVACRSYALHQAASRRDQDWDLLAGTGSQVYRGVAAETPSVRAAVASTRGEVLVHAGEPALAVYHSASGGRTASAEEVWGKPVPYLSSVEVESEEDSPDTYWRLELSSEAMGRVLAASGHSVGPVRRARVLGRSASGRVLEIEFEGTRGRARLGGRALRGALGDEELRSTLFEVRNREESVVFVGTGRGHGVGMSQWGAQGMALRGKSYREILEHFYPGTRLETLDGRGVAVLGEETGEKTGEKSGERSSAAVAAGGAGQ